MVRRAARLFKRTTTDLLGRYLRALRDTRDPLLVHALLDAVMLAFLKPGQPAASQGAVQPNRFRPISIAGAFARCILAKAVTLSRKRLRDLLDPLGQYALTGTHRPIADLMAATATCSRIDVPYALTRADIVNAFGSAGQRALLQAIGRIATVAPELAALSLRAQCSTRDGGAVEMLLRGEYAAADERLAVRRWARGGAQGPPDMPAAFAMVMAMVDEDAMARAGDTAGGPGPVPPTTEEAAEELWALFRLVSPDLPAGPAEAWVDALRELLAERRSLESVSTLYADDAHSAGHFYTAIRRTLWRVVCGRERGLQEAPRKCGLLTAPRWRHLLDTLIAPLRRNADEWPMLESMKVLGVTFTDPGDEARVHAALVDSLADTVVAPIQRLTREVEDGARKGTALFLLHRYVLPVLAYHQSAWGLLAAPGVWRGADDALDAFCRALCPDDLRGALVRGDTLRRELALPRGDGGLGIPLAAAEAPLKAAALWPRQRAVAAGARAELTHGAYRQTRNALGLAEWAAVTIEAHHRDTAKALHDAASARGERRRLEQNAMRGGTRALAVVPWREDLAIDNVEFDVAWRLIFGGMTAEMVSRIDRPEHGFRWRGSRMEWALDQALHDCLPPGAVTTGAQPVPELTPPGAKELDPADRADVDVLTRAGRRHVFDVRTVNAQCASAVRAGTTEAHCAAIEAEKTRHYARYYRHFHPLVITLSGAVPKASAKALGQVMRDVARGDRSVLDWEPARWTDNILHRLAVEMIKTVTVIVSRAVSLPPPCPTRGRPPRAPRLGQRCALQKPFCHMIV